MKTLVLALCLIASSAFAADIKVLEMADPNINPVRLQTQFEVNRELGRAWVAIETQFVNRNVDSSSPIYYRQLVPGLAYDAARKVVTLEHEGQLIDCATVAQRGVSIFRHDVIKNTNCSLKIKHAEVEVDNGFEVRKHKVVQVILSHQ